MRLVSPISCWHVTRISPHSVRLTNEWQSVNSPFIIIYLKPGGGELHLQKLHLGEFQFRMLIHGQKIPGKNISLKSLWTIMRDGHHYELHHGLGKWKGEVNSLDLSRLHT